MRHNYHKLVRDRIPEIIQAAGRQCEVAILNEDEYRHALRQKLVEEAQEAQTCTDNELLIELADIQEVLDALLQAYGISPNDLAQVQAKRRRDRGGFDQQIFLLWSEQE
jgi:predicted house-cleaning noncanonical NTP pyrophosphatase (MazG superfamily)